MRIGASFDKLGELHGVTDGISVTARPISLLLGSALALAAAAIIARAGDGDLRVKILDVTSAETETHSDIVFALQNDLARIGFDAKIVECGPIIEYVEQMSSGHDSSFGAVCRVKSEHGVASLMMCDDWMVGKFTLAPRSGDRDGLDSFVAKNCPPGG